MTDNLNPPRRAVPPPDQSAFARGRDKFRRDFGEPLASEDWRGPQRSQWDDPYDDCC